MYIYVCETGTHKKLALTAGAKRLESDIYQREKLNIPVMTVYLIRRKYIPQEMKAAEAKYIIKHMDIHAGRA